ncbi:hypothetical protein L3Q82_010458 [Scortum barcoo]|uniref:Uncharacterized protein n=1 Tax=Scortum barcoo TaxID=214431 RepID=A0ACB8WC88_9TELE|nr:hypothetical protein L3Q82_010458 [Scortum barcoo]
MLKALDIVDLSWLICSFSFLLRDSQNEILRKDAPAGERDIWNALLPL